MKALFEFHWNLFLNQRSNYDLLAKLDELRIYSHQLDQFACSKILSLELILEKQCYFMIQSSSLTANYFIEIN